MVLDIIGFSTAGVTDIEISAQNSSENVVFTVDISNQYDISRVSINNDVSFCHLDKNTNIYYFKKQFTLEDYNEGEYTEVFTLTVEDVSGNIVQDTVNINLAVYHYYVQTVSYFITINANINQNLYSVPDPSNSNLNIIGLLGGYVESVSGNDIYDACYNLPTCNILLKAGVMVASNYSNTDTEFFDVELDLSLNSNGYINSKLKLVVGEQQTNRKVAIIKEEEPIYVEILNWPSYDLSSIENKTQQELLDLVINNNDVYYFEKEDVQSLEDLYNLNVIESWKFEICKVPAVKDNLIEQYADFNNKTYPNIFTDGEYIILETAHDYSVKFTDSNGDDCVLVSKEKIYAVVSHDSTKPSFKQLL